MEEVREFWDAAAAGKVLWRKAEPYYTGSGRLANTAPVTAELVSSELYLD